MNELLELLLVFARLALLSFGAAFSVLPEMSRQLVEVHGWISPKEFADGYALGQLSPGPNMLAVFFYGYQVAGVPGALAAGLGMFGPPLVIVVSVARAWRAVGHLPWAESARQALLPVGAGLMAGGVLTLAKSAVHTLPLLVITGVALLLLIRLQLNPALVVLLGGALGVVFSLVA